MAVYIHEPMESPGSTESAQAARVFRPGRMFSHLTADTEQELREYAKSVGLLMKWIQKPGTYAVHFDVTGQRLRRIQNDPRVTKITLREFALQLRDKRDYERAKAATNAEQTVVQQKP